MLRRLSRLLAAHRDDLLVWSGVALLAIAGSSFHWTLGIVVLGVFLVADGVLGGER